MQRLLLLALLSAPLAAADEPADAQTLREVGLETDGPGLLRYFRERTLDARGRERLAELVRQLGHRSFVTREKATQALLAAGDSARPLLQAALKDPDIEIVRRAEQ